ncbi:hypothetical protein [Aristophania vespae]|uniref:hypothetical protein n=1 Tax=Aristophania vespae TaxID=2697033 RepID=UPI0023511EBE|nr:hypothetical protein [Aristophania vespae]
MSVCALSGLTHAQAEEDFVKDFCSRHPENCSHTGVSHEQLVQVQAQMSARYELWLRQAGLTPETARKAVWALNHKPHSSCAFKASTIVSDFEAARFGNNLDDDLETPVIQIEVNHLCDKRNLDQ